MRLLIIPKSYCLLITHLNWWNVRHFSHWSSSRKTHLPTIEKPGVLILAACENQGKHPKLSDTWKSIKIFKKKITGWQKNTKTTEIKIATKVFTSCKIRYKPSRKGM